MHAYNMSNVNLALREKFIFTGNIMKQLMHALSSFSNTEVNNCFINTCSIYLKSLITSRPKNYLTYISDNKPKPGSKFQNLCLEMVYNNSDNLQWVTYFSGIKVWASQHVFQMKVSIRLLLLQHDHRICLTQQRSSSSKFTQFNQLQHNLKAWYKIQ